MQFWFIKYKITVHFCTRLPYFLYILHNRVFLFIDMQNNSMFNILSLKKPSILFILSFTLAPSANIKARAPKLSLKKFIIQLVLFFPFLYTAHTVAYTFAILLKFVNLCTCIYYVSKN